MLFSTIIDLVFDWLGDFILFWDKSDTERIQTIQSARNQVLKSHDDLMVDSSKSHLLFCTEKGMHLVSRKSSWKAILTTEEISLYEKRGRKVFARIERAHKQNGK